MLDSEADVCDTNCIQLPLWCVCSPTGHTHVILEPPEFLRRRAALILEKIGDRIPIDEMRVTAEN